MEESNFMKKDPFVFVAQHPYQVRVGKVMQDIDLGEVARSYDFGDTGGLISEKTGVNNIATLIHCEPGQRFNVLSASRITAEGVPGRVEPTDKGLKIAQLEGDGCSEDYLRTTIASFALPTDVRLLWNIEVQFGDEAAPWQLTPPGSDPALIWQIKAPGLQPSLAAVVDTDDSDPTKLMIYFSLKMHSQAQILRAGTIKGITPHERVNLVIEALLDEKRLEEGGLGYWYAKVNNRVAVSYNGPTLIEAADAPHQWFCGLYRYLTHGPAKIQRLTYWPFMRLFQV